MPLLPRRRLPLTYNSPGLDMNIAAKLRARHKGNLDVSRNTGMSDAVSRAVANRMRKPAVINKPGITTRLGGGAPASPPVDPLMTQANNTVFGMVNPLMQRLAAQRVAAEASARKQYEGHATALEGALGATAAPIGASYDKAIGQSAAVNEAVANRLGAVGGQQASGLAAQLAQIGADPAGAASLAQTYQGAGGADFARGGADLQHLIGRQAEAGAYTNKLPQIGRLEANRDLASALSDLRGEFGTQEQELTTNAVNQAYDMYGTLRGEKREDQQARTQNQQAQDEIRSRERMALQALRSTATSKAEERQYDTMIKLQERQWDLDDADADREFEGWQTEFNANNKTPKSPKLTGPANQKFITTIDGNVIKNPNYVPPTKAKPGGTDNDSWKTPGSAKRQRVITSVRDSIVNPETGQIRDKFVFSATPDKNISKKIWSVLQVQGISPTSPEGKKLYKDIFMALEGTPSAKGAYQLPQFMGGK